jgi:hypothetical protein
VSVSHALLLPSADFLRYLPGANEYGSFDLLFHVWDATTGSAGTYVYVPATGGASSFSAMGGMILAPVTPVNQAPTWTGTTAAMTPVLPGSYSLTGAVPPGDSVDSICGNLFSDVDGTTLSSGGVAIVGTSATANGTWQYSTNGGSTWTSFGTLKTTFGVPSASNALLLSATDLLRYAPNAGFSGTATLHARAWDGSQGTAAAAGASKGYTITATGGTTAFSGNLLTISCAVNTAPTLGTASGPTLPATIEGVTSLVSVVTLAKDAQLSDSDPRALQGIAIVGVGGTGEWPGSWQYSLDGKTWSAVPAVSEASALLLSSTAQLRFVSAVQASGSNLTALVTLTYRAWDQTAGTAGELFAVTAAGGATSISSTEVTASLPVKYAHHAPTWTATTASLTPVLTGTYSLTGTTPAGDTVASLYGSSFSDVDGNSVGVAIVAAGGSAHGAWQYSTDGGTTWTGFGAAGTTFGVASSSNALLLSTSDLIRFVPNAGFDGTATVQAYAWDGTQGTAAVPGASKGYKIAATGGASAFSATLLTATVLVNTAPVLTT